MFLLNGTNKLTRFFELYLPNAFLFAIILTFVAAILAVSFTSNSAGQVVSYWGDGFWNLNKFAMEMTLILVTGSTFALCPPIQKFLQKLTEKIESETQAILLITFVSGLCSLFNWGFGLVISGILVLIMAEKLKRCNYGLLVASGYSGFLLWHGGLSGSIPLKLTSPSSLIQNIINQESIMLDQTIFTQYNVILVVANFLVILFLNYFLSKKSSEKKEIDFKMEFFLDDNAKENSIVRKAEQTAVVAFVLGGAGFIYLVGYVYFNGFKLNLAILTWLFLFLGIIFAGSLQHYLQLFEKSVGKCSGIILQFPFYAGVMAIMSKSGLADIFSDWIIAMANKQTFLMMTYLSAGVVNFFVPSGGGQWAIQGPIILSAAKQLGVSLPQASMAIAWGDAWTNMIQPFWAMPLLSLAGVKLSEMMRYTFFVFMLSGIASSIIFVIMGL